MRLTFRFHFALTFASLLIVPAVELLAQQSAKTGQRPTQSAPSTKVPTQKAPPKDDSPPKKQAEEVDPDQVKMLERLDQILARWEAESSKIKSLHGTHSRSEFNNAFASETVSKGTFFLEMPDKGRIDFKSVEIKKGEVSKRMTKTSPEGKPPEPYSLVTGKAERWICTGEMILNLDDEEKTYRKDIIPEELRGKNIVESPLPFLFGLKKEEAKSRFKLSIFGQETKEIVTLLAIPKMAKDLENYEKALITLDKKTYLPTQVRTLDQSKLEILYSFSSVVVNDRDVRSQFAKLFNLDKDPFKPNLNGYNLALPPEDSFPKDIQPASRNETNPPTKNPAVKKTVQSPNSKDTQRR